MLSKIPHITLQRERERSQHTHTHIIHTHHTPYIPPPPKFGAARWVLRRIASNQQNTKLLLIPSCFREPQPTTHDTPHHTIPTIKYSQNVGWSRSDWIVESIQIYYSMEYIILYISCTFSHVIVLYYDIDERRNTWWIHLSSRAGTSGLCREGCTPVQTTRAGYIGTINEYVNSRIGTQCRGNGTGQLCIIEQIRDCE